MKPDDVYQWKQEAYQKCIKSLQGLSPRAKADAWMGCVARKIEGCLDQEALVYRRSRGHDCRGEIDRLTSDWHRDSRHEIERYADGMQIWAPDTGESEREGRITISNAGDVINVSPDLLRNFWSGLDPEELYLDATMLRTTDWCRIGGFREWWERLARYTREDIVQGGLDPIPGSFWLFSMLRSDYAIRILRPTLERALDALEITLHGTRYPWRRWRWDANGKRGSNPVDCFAYASTIAFADRRLHSSRHVSELAGQAVETLLKNWDSEVGAWRGWADDQCPSVEATAMAVHALALVRPPGWERVVAKARDWLWLQQDPREGYWDDPSAPNRVYLSVLVLDAIDLADGRTSLTFGITPIETASAEAAPTSSSGSQFMELAVEEAQKSVGEDDRTHPLVGVVVVKDGEVLASAHRGEVPGSHAEFVALDVKLNGQDLAGATVYTTLEPCTTRNHPKIPCATRLCEARVSRVVIGILDPNPTIRGNGVWTLWDAGIETGWFPKDLRDAVASLNRAFIRLHRNAREPSLDNRIEQQLWEKLRWILKDGLTPEEEADFRRWLATVDPKQDV